MTRRITYLKMGNSMEPGARMTSENENPIALTAYELLAQRYSERAEGKSENGYIEHPAMRAALGPVAELRVLDAGCGPGILTSHLIKSGAKVSAFDISPKMIELARKRTAGAAKLFVADMAKLIPDLADAEFDMVVSSLAIDYVRDWATPLGEFHRVLKPGGRLLFSVQHPIGAFLWYQPPSAFGIHYVEATWRGFGGEPVVVPDYYRSFEEMINPLIAAGFAITKLTDAKPIDALKAIDPTDYEKYSRQPTFMVIDARKL